nr:hypothetical protein [Actinomycetales bacterium]
MAIPDFAVDLALPSSAPGPVVVSQEALARYSSATGLQQIPGTPTLGGRDPRHPAIPYEGVDAPRVVIADGGTSLLTVPDDGSEPTVLFTGEDLSPPSIDRYGFIWTTQGGIAHEIVAVRADGSLYRIDATWLEGRRVSSVRLAVDGARAVVVSNTEDRTFVELVGVGRDSLGRPRSLGEPLRIAEFLDEVLDSTWAGPVSLVILGTTVADDTVRVHRVSIGGLNTVLPLVADAVAVASSRNERSVVVTNSSGALYLRSGAAWQMVVTGIADPVYSG